jgi:UDP-4-amino-4,6-dideoxy-N-acetyl-beta-L-altrosamine transaminase
MGDDILPYGRQWIDDDDVAAVVAALRGDYLTTGPTVGRFEVALAERLGAPHAVAVCNGTAALHAACDVLGLGPGDEVLVPAITFLASANCARYVGAEPVFVDVDPDSGLIDVADARRKVTPRTRAIVPVHLTGRPADLQAVRALADEHRLKVIEDAAHALGATYGATRVGDCALSDATVLSFHPVKHITTAEGGAITTRDPALAVALDRFRNHGMVRQAADLAQPSPGPWYYEQQTLGYNYRLTDLQSALGLSQLGKLDGFLARRRALAARYDAALAALPGVRPVAVGTADTVSAYHLYSVLIDFAGCGVDRATVMARLRERGVLTQVHYIPVPAQPYYIARGADLATLPGARAYYERTLSLPMYPAMTDADADRVVAALAEALG